MYCDEHEVSVSDAKQTLELMETLGYTERTIVDKIRNVYRFDMFEVVIDNVKDLGLENYRRRNKRAIDRSAKRRTSRPEL